MWQKRFTFLLQAGNLRFPAMTRELRSLEPRGSEVVRERSSLVMTRRLRRLEPRAASPPSRACRGLSNRFIFLLASIITELTLLLGPAVALRTRGREPHFDERRRALDPVPDRGGRLSPCSGDARDGEHRRSRTRTVALRRERSLAVPSCNGRRADCPPTGGRTTAAIRSRRRTRRGPPSSGVSRSTRAFNTSSSISASCRSRSGTGRSSVTRA